MRKTVYQIIGFICYYCIRRSWELLSAKVNADIFSSRRLAYCNLPNAQLDPFSAFYQSPNRNIGKVVKITSIYTYGVQLNYYPKRLNCECATSSGVQINNPVRLLLPLTSSVALSHLLRKRRPN